MPNCNRCNAPINFTQLPDGKWKPVNMDGSPHQCQRQQAARGGGRKPSYDPRQFVSNVVAAAIQGGLIKQPQDIDQWSKAAYQAVTHLVQTPPPAAANMAQEAPPTQQYNEQNPPNFDYDQDTPF